jgi:importin-5
MSLLPPEIHAALAQLLQALVASDNAIRSSAEEQLSTDWVQARPDVLLMALVEQIQGSEDPGVNSLACIPTCWSRDYTF